MSGANPVDPKPAGPAALTEPPKAPAAKPRPWSLLGRKQKLWLTACGLGVASAAVVYGYKYFTPNPGTAVAQSDTTTAPTQATPKPDEPGRLPATTTDVPEVKVPAIIRPVKIEGPDVTPPDIKPILPGRTIRPPVPPADDDDTDDPDLPPIKPPVPGKTKADDDDGPALVVPPIPGKVPDRSKDDDTPPLVSPPGPKKDKADPKKPAESDPFKAIAPLGPAPLPADVTERKERGPMPVIRIGGTESGPASRAGDPPPPPIPTLDVDVPPLPPVPGTPKKEKDELPHIIVPPAKDRENPPAIKVPTTDETPAPPTIRSPMIPDITPTKPPGLADTLPPPPAAGRTSDVRKENYDEDWHTYREGDTYASICVEYLHDAKYAKALETYNKERRKPGDQYVFVPPPYVLENRFPSLIAETDRPARPEVKPAGNVKFEPVAPASGTSRPAPPPAIGSNEEYRVTNEAGEMIRDIARRLYGSPEAWRKLYDANPGIDPTQPIPSGTTLRLGR